MKPGLLPPSVVVVPLLLGLLSSSADAQRRKKKDRDKEAPTSSDTPKKKEKESKDAKPPPTLDFTGIKFEGTLHTPQLLYFLDRASEELERASLERRSFIPEMIKSIDEDDL